MVAWALVEGESESLWRCFLSHLHTAIPNLNSPMTTIMSYPDKGLRAADNGILLANRVFCVGHISRNIQGNCGVPSRIAFSAHIRFSLTEERVWTGFAMLQDISPQAAAYLEGILLALLAAPYLLWRRYGHNTSNLIEVMNKWILEERRLSALDVLHSLWSECMDFPFRRLQEAQKYRDSGAILTKYFSRLLRESMDIRLSDKFVMRMLTMHRYTRSPASQRICTRGRPQHNDTPRHAIPPTPQRNTRDYVSNKLTVIAMVATYLHTIYTLWAQCGHYRSPSCGNAGHPYLKIEGVPGLLTLRAANSGHIVRPGLGAYQAPQPYTAMQPMQRKVPQ